MDESLQRIVFERLEADGSLDLDWSVYVIAACNGPADLESLLESSSAPEPSQLAPPAPDSTPAGAYLSSITVQGFRGIGPEATLKLKAGPGFTLVVGRNGSGKSSFADALEVLFTGDSHRWAGRRAQVWKQGWRNLHHRHPAMVEADLLVEGSGQTTATRRWEEKDDVDAGVAEVQPHGKPKQNLDSLGWTEALVTHRPFLSYNELSSMLDEGPGKLYDALSLVLGLEDLVEAQTALSNSRRNRKKAMDAAKNALVPLRARLEQVRDEGGDQRAVDCLAATGGPTWDLDSLEALTGDDTTAAGEIDCLRRVVALELPPPAQVAEAAARLKQAAQTLEAATGSGSHRAGTLASLLEKALDYHEHDNGTDCPVCKSPGALDPQWKSRAQDEAARLRAEAAAWDQAERGVREAAREAKELLVPVPSALQDAAGVVAVEPTLAAWKQWRAGDTLTSAEELADHLQTHHEPLIYALNTLTVEAQTELNARQERWRPMARDLIQWAKEARSASLGMKHDRSLKAAEEWLKKTGDSIRAQRFEPIGNQAIELWEHLRQQSNVELGKIELAGAKTRRRVTLDVTIDGVAGAALGVMSQGELHALALSLFLPRATLEESPFRFVVVDDPVQSMDPARVDGLARAFEEVAKERQVIVFTHDDRLSDAVRRLGIEATTIGVTRRPASVVELRPTLDPVAAYLDDALALVNDPRLPEDVRRRVVPGFCRSALEAVFTDRVRRRRLTAAAEHAAVEEELASANSLTELGAMALFGDKGRGSEVMTRLNKLGGWAGDTFRQVNKGAHHAYPGSLYKLVTDSEKLCKQIGALKIK
ncbi:MAG: AAA family ATPase [Actinomycetota bacterium]|nr:AAA family ATPase [Actinomycetota bacterium]